ncbi:MULTISPECIES: AAA family ATPase [unclassified Flavobacterium]|uniref:AAA family ATPase n=1 Tax=unclassified Flavobacterium TaxID=196869 RepID=UPI0009635074|nr:MULTISPECIES: AAA family ATPase [unclassified Flavobacterium]MBN9283173.1 AAA family ATPase [Flavobacterium sp.]OJV67799.1 MAG: hypothetical protein BGO42_17405 [Flavobacterium sp. 40-81]
MEILYVYIDDYKILKEANVNFGSEYFFNYSKETNLLTYKKNETFIEGFYNIDYNSESKIKNLCYLVGNNGAGKSTVLEFIRENFSKGLNIRDETIVIYKKENELHCISTIKFKQEVALIKPDFTEILSKPEDQMGFDFGYDKRGLEDLDIIFFSNIFDGKISSKRKGLHDISTNCLVVDDHDFYVKQKLIEKDTDTLSIHFSQEVYRQFNFLSSELREKFHLFKIPEYLFLKVEINSKSIDSFEFSDKKTNRIYTSYKSDLLGHILELKSDINDSLKCFISLIVLNLIKEISSSNHPESGFEMDFYPNTSLNQDSNFDLVIQEYLKSIKKQLGKLIYRIPRIESLLEKNASLIEFIFQNKESLINYYPDKSKPLFFISIKSEDTIKNFFKLYNDSVTINPYVFFNFEGFSSGERSILNIFSRFYDLVVQDEKFQNLSNEILILMDEPDLYLHPTWQKKLNKFLIEFLPIIFKERNLQIIITSNSPLPLTDVLSNNVVFLRSNESGDEKVKKQIEIKDNLDNYIPTFGQNIYSLFKESFFLEQGLMGDFVNLKLNELADFLNKDNIENEFWKKNSLTVINNIGEPIIRNSFRQLYFKKYNDEIDNEIKRLQAIKKK